MDGGVDTDLATDGQLKRIGTVVKLVNSQFESLTRTGSTAEYCAIALDGSNKPVVVYADVDTGTLRLARASSATPTAARYFLQATIMKGLLRIILLHNSTQKVIYILCSATHGDRFAM